MSDEAIVTVEIRVSPVPRIYLVMRYPSGGGACKEMELPEVDELVSRLINATFHVKTLEVAGSDRDRVAEMLGSSNGGLVVK